MILKGKVHKYGANINTDEIIPARYLNTTDPCDLATHCMEDIDKDFIKKVSQGDFIVAAENFGCGSSREHAPLCIKYAGVSAVIAKSFARIFFRNSINIGLPILESLEACDKILPGDVLEVDLASGEINNVTRSEVYHAQAFPPFMQEIIAKGGLLEYIRSKNTVQGAKKNAFTEKRVVPRITMGNVPAEIYDEDESTLLGIGYISNLAVHNCGLSSTLNLRMDKEYFMRFLIEGNVINVWIKVARVETQDRNKFYGIKFSKIDVTIQKSLKEFVENKL